MKIGMDFRPAVAAPYSGIGRQVLAMAEVLTSSAIDQLVGYAGTATAPTVGGQTNYLIHHPEPAQPADGMHRPHHRWRFEAGYLPAQLVHDQIELYIATANRGLPLTRQRGNYRQVLLLHDMFQWTHADAHQSQLKALAYRLIERGSLWWSLRRADAIWTPSAYSAEQVANLFPELRPRLRCLPNCVQPLPVSTDPRLRADIPTRFWLTVGTRGPRKNIERLLQAWRGLRQHQVDVPDLVLVGASTDLPAAFRNDHGLHVLSDISDAQLGALYQAAEWLWHPAFAEGFGLPVIEALAAGTPVAVAYGSALDEVCPESAIRFDPYASEAIAQRMCEVSAMTTPLSARECQDFAARFGPKAYAARLTQLLEELRS